MLLPIEQGDLFDSPLGILQIKKFIGKGKSAFSYLAELQGKSVVLKIMHDEPVPYYSFSSNKVELEKNAYEILSRCCVPLPKLLCAESSKNFLIKNFIEGQDGIEWVIKNGATEEVIAQLFEIAKKVAASNFNIDYFPANFVVANRKLFYIDYEINPFLPQWSFPNWGIYYWANRAGLKKFKETGNASAINSDLQKGIPLKEPFEQIVQKWISKFGI